MTPRDSTAEDDLPHGRPHTFTPIADIGAWSLAHPPATRFFVPTGLTVRGTTLVTAEAGPVPHLPQDGKVIVLASVVTGRMRRRAARR